MTKRHLPENVFNSTRLSFFHPQSEQCSFRHCRRANLSRRLGLCSYFFAYTTKVVGIAVAKTLAGTNCVRLGQLCRQATIVKVSRTTTRRCKPWTAETSAKHVQRASRAVAAMLNRLGTPAQCPDEQHTSAQPLALLKTKSSRSINRAVFRVELVVQVLQMCFEVRCAVSSSGLKPVTCYQSVWQESTQTARHFGPVPMSTAHVHAVSSSSTSNCLEHGQFAPAQTSWAGQEVA